MKDDLKGIGTSGQAGRGNRATSPSKAARSLAGPAKPAAPKKRATAAKPAAAEPKKAAAKKPAAKAAATKKTAATKKAAPKEAPAKKAAATKPAATKAAAKERTPSESGAAKVAEERLDAKAGAKERHLHSVPDGESSREEPPKQATEGLDPDDLAAAFAEGAKRLLGSDLGAKLATTVAALRRRASGDYEVDEFGLDPEMHELFNSLIEPLAESWFRLQVRGIENIPTDGGALLVANHSGTVPVDGLVTGYAVMKNTGRPIRPLGADLVFKLPYVGQIARKMGATLACAEDAERLLAAGELAAVWPEGFKGVGKPFSERYKLQRFGRGGFVSAAMRAQVPIIPVSIVGAEEIYPLVGNIPSLARLFGLPYIPITPFFPLLGPLGLIPLPSKWIIEFGEPVRTDAYPPEAADDPMLLFNVTDQVRETIQQTLYNLLVERGNPFV